MNPTRSVNGSVLGAASLAPWSDVSESESEPPSPQAVTRRKLARTTAARGLRRELGTGGVLPEETRVVELTVEGCDRVALDGARPALRGRRPGGRAGGGAARGTRAGCRG